MITIRSRSGLFSDALGAPLTQSVEYWSYEPKVVGSSPTWSSPRFEAVPSASTFPPLFGGVVCCVVLCCVVLCCVVLCCVVLCCVVLCCVVLRVCVLRVCVLHVYVSLKKKETRRRWIRTTGTLLPLGFEVQALNLQSSSAQNCRV
jgi:hypothetical protein